MYICTVKPFLKGILLIRTQTQLPPSYYFMVLLCFQRCARELGQWETLNDFGKSQNGASPFLGKRSCQATYKDDLLHFSIKDLLIHTHTHAHVYTHARTHAHARTHTHTHTHNSPRECLVCTRLDSHERSLNTGRTNLLRELQCQVKPAPRIPGSVLS